MEPIQVIELSKSERLFRLLQQIYTPSASSSRVAALGVLRRIFDLEDMESRTVIAASDDWDIRIARHQIGTTDWFLCVEGRGFHPDIFKVHGEPFIVQQGDTDGQRQSSPVVNAGIIVGVMPGHEPPQNVRDAIRGLPLPTWGRATKDWSIGGFLHGSARIPSTAEFLAENGVHEVQLPPKLVVKSVDRDAGTISVGPGKATEFEQGDSISIVTEDPEYIIDGETVRTSELDLSAPDGYFWAVVRCGDGGASFELVHGDHVVGGVDEWSCGAWRYCAGGVEGEASTYRMAMTSAAVMVCHGSEKPEESPTIEPESDKNGTAPTLRQDISTAAKNDAIRRIIRGLGEHMHFVLWHSRENARTCVMTGSTFVQVRHEARDGVSNPWTWTGGDTFSMDNGHPYESPEWLLLIDLIVANHPWARDDK